MRPRVWRRPQALAAGRRRRMACDGGGGALGLGARTEEKKGNRRENGAEKEASLKSRCARGWVHVGR